MAILYIHVHVHVYDLLYIACKSIVVRTTKHTVALIFGI